MAEISTNIRINWYRVTDTTILYQKINQSYNSSFFLAQHATVFEQDLCQLVEKLKQFTFLDIYGKIHREKVEVYRSMAQVRFPHSRTDVEISRFRLWL